MRKVILVLALIIPALVSCNRNDDFEKAYKSITGEELASYVENLASDDFQGRAPFTEGESLIVNYLAEKLGEIGFEPAFGSSYFQEVKAIVVGKKGLARVKSGRGGKHASSG